MTTINKIYICFITFDGLIDNEIFLSEIFLTKWLKSLPYLWKPLGPHTPRTQLKEYHHPSTPPRRGGGLVINHLWAFFAEIYLTPPPIAKSANDVITQTKSDKDNGMVEDLKLFQARKQVFLKQFLKRKFGVQSPSISLRKCSSLLSDSRGYQLTDLHFIWRLCALRY